MRGQGIFVVEFKIRMMVMFPELILLRRSWLINRQNYVWQKKFFRAAFRGLARKSDAEGEKEEDNSAENMSILDRQSDGCNYLGIQECEDHLLVHGRYVYDSKQAREQIQRKYRPLLRPNQNISAGFRRKLGMLNVRLDSENRPQFHGEFERQDQTEFKTLDDVMQHLQTHKVERFRKEESAEIIRRPFEMMAIDERIERKPSRIQPKSLIDDKINFRYVDDKLFEKTKEQPDQKPKVFEQDDWISYEQSKREPKSKQEEKEMSLSEKIASIKLEPEPDVESGRKAPKILTGEEYLKQIRAGKRMEHFQKEFDELRTLIGKNEKLDSKGYRLLSNQVPDFSSMTNDEILEMLLKQILFNDSDVVALNKPYGISVHGAFGSTTVSTSQVNSRYRHIIHLGFFLPEMANRLQCEKLYPVHRLDRDTTGLLLMAKTQEKAHLLNRLFQEHKIEKRYLCITKNRPDHPEGIIDIPIDIGHIRTKDGKKRERMVLCPEPAEGQQLLRKWRSARRAITHYKIKSNHGNATLLEVIPQTGVRHQIRVHLGFALRCPILGDHKYSQMDNLAPQKLPSDILMALKIRQTKTRHVPMHLHAHQLMVPEAGLDGRNIFLRAPLPYHFQRNMKALKLKLD